MNAAREVGFGVVGCGGIGRWHARNIKLLPGLRLVGVAEADDAARKRAVKELRVPAYADPDDLLAQPDLEVVSICTPPGSHAALAIQATAAGKHVLVEKPLAVSLAEADAVLAACARAGVKLGVVHQLRGHAAVRALHGLITTGKLGRPLLAVGIHGWFRDQAQLDRHAWRTAAGAGLLLDQAIHLVDLIVWMMGPPMWVSGAGGSLILKSAGEDTAVATMQFAGGGFATLAASTSVNLMRDDTALEVMGTRGGARLEIRDYDNAELTRLDLAPGENTRSRALQQAQIEALIEGHGGDWRRGPHSPIWRTLGTLVGPGRGTRPFRSPAAFLRRLVDRKAQAEHGQPQAHAAILAQMAVAARSDALPLVTGAEARASLAVVDAIARSTAMEGARVIPVSPGETARPEAGRRAPQPSADSVPGR